VSKQTQVLVLDEPLSGLDSYTALQLMRSLQAVADSGRVVALSLHQPSPALFGALDNAMLLAGGVLVYSGPPHAAAAALAGLGCPVPPGVLLFDVLVATARGAGCCTLVWGVYTTTLSLTRCCVVLLSLLLQASRWRSTCCTSCLTQPA
jgi:energy-coupling factor transporter ATP-binding protein EcfA2